LVDPPPPDEDVVVELPPPHPKVVPAVIRATITISPSPYRRLRGTTIKRQTAANAPPPKGSHGVLKRAELAAVVLTVRVEVAGVPVETWPCDGFKLQVGGSCGVPEPWDATEQVKFTVPENPPADETCMGAVAEPPEEAVIPVEVVATETVDPVPFNVTVCGRLFAPPVMVIAPVSAPPEVGAKVTEIVQFPPTATLEPQVFVSAKFVEAEIDPMINAALPSFVSVIVCAALVEPTACEEKLRLDGESMATGPAAGVMVNVPFTYVKV
jgi:hypothetical protein